MNLRKTLVACGIAIACISTAGLAQDMFHTIDRGRHPYLGGAQELIGQAFVKISDGQKVVHNMGGHAQRAKDLLQQASAELKLAEDSER